jgi:hypothetical protein
MKFFLFLILSFPLLAFSFETGKYSGTSIDGQQECRLDITQNENSFTIHSYECVDNVLGRSFTSEEKEWIFGKTKTYFPEFKMTMTTDVKLDKYTMNYSNRKKTESYDEELTNIGNHSISVKFSITHENVYNPWFDLVMKRVH